MFYGDSWYALINMLDHGMGGYFFDHPTWLFAVPIALVFAAALLSWLRKLLPQTTCLLCIISIASAATLYGVATLITAIPAVMMVLFALCVRYSAPSYLRQQRALEH